ncbi:hypothetical protein Droror1_Dr00024640 [Drosera rotundifolia]
MEENLMPVGSAFVGLDLQGSMKMNHNQNPKGLHHTKSHQGSLPLTMGQVYEFEQPNLSADSGKVDRGKASASDEDDQSMNDDGVDGGNYQGKGKRVLHWQRVKWTDSMVRLLITAVSYIGEDVVSECGPGGRRKYANLQKKGKWKSVSKVMAERGFCVSPQQCEDKFNDLNKRYKKLNEILGRGTSCQVVENPVLLDMMDHLSEKTKEEVRKILSSKHLFYEEMCSYHNGNRLHLPHDAALQRSLQLALRSRDDHEPGDSQRLLPDEVDEDDHDIESDDQEEYEENCGQGYGVSGDAAKRMKLGSGLDKFTFGNSLNPQDLNKSFLQPHNPHLDANAAFPDPSKAAWMQKQWFESRSLELQQQKMQIEVEMLELEKQRFKWLRFSRKKDRELEKMKMENERLKLENDRMTLELKQMEMSMQSNQ